MTKRVYTRAEYDAVMALAAQGKSLAEIEAATGVGRGAAYRMRAGQWQGTKLSRELTGRAALTAALEPYLGGGHDLDDLTVLTAVNDPFRQDTERGHRDAAWLVEAAAAVGIDFAAGARVHLRGLHYALLGQARPDGKPYVNTYEQWCWLYGQAAKAARWLGYVNFDQIIDQRNAEPLVYQAPAEPQPYIDVAADADGYEWRLPYAGDFAPEPRLTGHEVHQPYRVAMIGEKSSLEPVLRPLAERYSCDLYLPTGEISETQVYRLASTAARDGRPLAVLYFADCDPAGWQMGVSVARKLQAFRELLHGGLEFELYRVALTPDQVRGLDLPSTPLKAGEARADKWQRRTGMQQTEVDAMIALRPGELDRLARQAISQFRDTGLADRARQAREEWEREARRVIDEGMDGGRAEAVAAAQQLLDEAGDRVRWARDLLQTSATDADLPEFTPPEADPPGPAARAEAIGTPLVTTEWAYPAQCRALKDSKAYGGDEE